MKAYSRENCSFQSQKSHKKVAFQLHYEGQKNMADGRSIRATLSLE